MGLLTDKVVLVTGGSRGIGRAICVAAGKEGATVVVNFAGNESAANETKSMVEAAGGRAEIKQFDVGDADAVTAAIGAIKETHGGLHVLVNNAGIAKDGLLLRFKDEDWSKCIETNLSGAFYCARAAAKIMTRQRTGRIINISSVVGEAGNGGQAAYAAAKSGLFGLTKSLAHELSSRAITVNAVTPGFIETDMTSSISDDMRQKAMDHIPLGRAGTADEVAHAVVFLASDNAAYITGQILGVNGGMYM